MIRAVVFDMDGVLIDAREWHKVALNEALELFGAEISDADHALKFDGLPTKRKLEMLSNAGLIPWRLHSLIEAVKQDRTLRIASTRCYPLNNVLFTLGYIKSLGLRVGVATNSIRRTAEVMLGMSGVSPSIDLLLTNQDVINPKPDPEIYLKSASLLGVKPSETLVVEDNENGVKSALSAGCRVLRVSDPSEVTADAIREALGI
ncbi:MAG: hypothetical protein RLZZ249_281 [Actinomycetota bacterium]